MRKRESGQIFVLVLLSLLSLIMLWLMVINVGKIVSERIIAQNAADAAAQTASCIRARGLNKIGALNAAIAGLLSVPMFNQRFVWYPEWRCYKFPVWVSVEDRIIKSVKREVEALVKAQEGINKTYGGGLAALKAMEVAKEQKLGRRGEKLGPEIKSLPFPPKKYSLRLKRNKRGILYFKTLNVGFDVPIVGHVHLIFPWPLPIKSIIGDVKSDLKTKKAPGGFIKTALTGLRICLDALAGDQLRGEKSWYVQAKDFHKKKITIIVSKKLEGWPIGKKLFGIKSSPEIMAIASSRPYNPKGPMFPRDEGDWTFAPIFEYFRALPGWDAQLVPVGKGFQH